MNNLKKSTRWFAGMMLVLPCLAFAQASSPAADDCCAKNPDICNRIMQNVNSQLGVDAQRIDAMMGTTPPPLNSLSCIDEILNQKIGAIFSFPGIDGILDGIMKSATQKVCSVANQAMRDATGGVNQQMTFPGIPAPWGGTIPGTGVSVGTRTTTGGGGVVVNGQQVGTIPSMATPGIVAVARVTPQSQQQPAEEPSLLSRAADAVATPFKNLFK